MAAPLPLPPPLSSPLPSRRPFRSLTALSPRPLKPLSTTAPKSSSEDQGPSPAPDPNTDSDPFESRLAQVRLKYRSGTGKKAEIRKAKKGKRGSDSGSGTKPGGMFLPPVPLKEPVSEGLKVEFGFSRYSERVNGRLAGLGLAALVLVELATGKSVIKYHTPAIVFLQVYFMAAACAVYLKYEKEKVSIWPLQGSSSGRSNDQ